MYQPGEVAIKFAEVREFVYDHLIFSNSRNGLRRFYAFMSKRKWCNLFKIYILNIEM